MLTCVKCGTESVRLRLGLCDSCYHRQRRGLNPERDREYCRRYREAHPGRIQDNQRNYRDRHRQELRDRGNRKTQELKLAVIENYGGRCVCCGEDNPVFLTVDHVNGGGQEDRRLEHGGRRFYARLKRLGYPKAEYQILCYNCNLAKGFFGHCPHEDKRV